MKYRLLYISVLLIMMSCDTPTPTNASDNHDITQPSNVEIRKNIVSESASRKLVDLPLNCITHPLPYKAGLVLSKEEDLSMPQEHHPTFYGCFDWHSAVHGHWSLVYLMKLFDDHAQKKEIFEALDHNITKANIQKEIEYFTLNRYTSSFERTYGWAWLLKLTEELYTWDHPKAKEWYEALSPLAELISKKYIEYLPKLVYPIRVGEHTNTAFGLSFAMDYAVALNNETLKTTISKKAREFYQDDKGCPISWEPSGYDFLSPCLQEVDIMRKVLSTSEFDSWFASFLDTEMIKQLEPAVVLDRSDGKLVHLDGLNFSRAWCLYPLSSYSKSFVQASDNHFEFSFSKISDGDYSGEHWLGSFALYALKMRNEHIQ